MQPNLPVFTLIKVNAFKTFMFCNRTLIGMLKSYFKTTKIKQPPLKECLKSGGFLKPTKHKILTSEPTKMNLIFRIRVAKISFSKSVKNV